MYRIQDYVICKGLGLCRILDIAPACCDNLSYQVLPAEKPQGTEPETIFFQQIKRPAMSKQQAQELIECLPHISDIQVTDEQSRRDLYEAAMGTDAPLDWVRVIKSAYLRQQNQQAQGYELQLAQSAKAQLYAELSLALELSEAQVEACIRRSIADE